jgi:formylglycine-generating enzyme required for sulfatase activity
VVPTLEWGISKHSKVKTDCQACHGVSRGHVVNERNEVKPDRVPHGAAIAGLCSTCHASGCPKTAKTASCETCHQVHALVDPNKTPNRNEELMKLVARWDQFQGKMKEGSDLAERSNWSAAQRDFRAALELMPGNPQATAKLELCERRLHPAVPGFDVVGNGFDAESGLPKEVKISALGVPMLLVPAGQCDIGSDTLANAQPVNTVRVGAFYLGKYEFTQAQWKALMGSNPSLHQGDNLPVEGVSWLACQTLIRKLNERVPGGGFRLPTEAEWEYACRAGSNPPPADELARFAWFRLNSVQVSGATPALVEIDAFAPRPVGTKEPNAWGLYDMYGNVWEWCSSLFKPYPYDAADGRESLTAEGLRVLRGGGFADYAEELDPAVRHGERPGREHRWNGLRLARSAPNPAAGK